MQQPLRRPAFSLHPITARLERLRQQPDVAQHGYARITRLSMDRLAAFEFHRLGPGFLRKRPAFCRACRTFEYDMNGMSPTMSASSAAGDGAGVMEHLLHRHRNGVLVTEHRHAERIADEDHIDAGFVDGERAGVIVGRNHGDGFAALFPGVQ